MCNLVRNTPEGTETLSEGDVENILQLRQTKVK